MFFRDLKDGSCALGTQEDHAELAGQFAAHWGNKDFAQLRPYETMVFAATYHDSGFRSWEGYPPINMEKGRPSGFREAPFSPPRLEGHTRNIEWIRAKDPYAGLIVSIHHTGLLQYRYQTITSPKTTTRSAPQRPEVQAFIDEQENSQKEQKKHLGGEDPKFDDEMWFNYRLLQIYDLLSLYFCCDGYVGHGLKENLIAPVPVAYGSKEEVNLHIIPTGANSVRMEPYPFDHSSLEVSVRARIMTSGSFASEDECMEAYFKAPRTFLNFEISN
jgi:hypothetical protein